VTVRRFWRRLRKNRLALAGLLTLAVFCCAALAASVIAPFDPYEMDATVTLSPPSAQHVFGTDQFGRDLLSRIIYGARISLKVGLISVTIALLMGTMIGTCAGHFAGWIDQVLSRVTDAMFAFPDILLALAIMAVLGPSTTNLMIAIGIVYTPIFARIARGSTLVVQNRQFIEAARTVGAGHVRIIVRHVLPNIVAPLVVQTTLSFAFAILSEAALSFLGLGVEPDVPSWGIMLKDGKDWMEQAWWIAVFPGVAISLAVLAFNVLGDGLRDAFDPETGSAGA
jgi:peptide/nickel transport system permease protein